MIVNVTPKEVLERYRLKDERVLLEYGNPITCQLWTVEKGNEVKGYITLSKDNVLTIKRTRKDPGTPVLENNILVIRDWQTKDIVYRKPGT
jgi:hypothetical protein